MLIEVIFNYYFDDAYLPILLWVVRDDWSHAKFQQNKLYLLLSLEKLVFGICISLTVSDSIMKISVPLLIGCLGLF